MIRKHIPNAITCLNLLSGCIAIVFAFQGTYLTAAWLIALAAVFDFLDGFAARLLKAYSPLGKELDSLADMVSFGVAPGMMIYGFISDSSFSTNNSEYLAYFAFLIPVFSALRLANFNLDERQATSFIGLPTPANALFWAFGIAGSFDYILDTTFDPFIIVTVTIFFSWLLVSNLPMFSLKFKHYKWRGNRLRYYFLAGCIALMLFLGISGLSACILWYIGLSFLSFISEKRRA
ncbi:MAG: CDP-diacylglycerol--serine O-phosphatidyltransferase [Bacteroidales bacterium]|nr:CDP-diacylglycerol--serine O-phosphatidyltransferase [Bacteroidales bacterium]